MKPRLLASAATAAALAVAAPSASALTLNFNGAPVENAQDVARMLGHAAGSSLQNGATVNVGGYKVVFDPRSLGGQLSDAFDPATGEHRVRAQRGRTSDGRAVSTPAVGILTSGFGPRWGRVHQGIDIANVSGTPIYAAMDGTVVEAGPASGFGNWVVIRHDGGEVTVYGHMRDYNVAAGQRVKAGQQIAAIGNEGESTGPHLHFEVKPDGVTQTDPQAWFEQQGITV